VPGERERESEASEQAHDEDGVDHQLPGPAGAKTAAGLRTGRAGSKGDKRKARPMLHQLPRRHPVNADGAAVTEIGTAVYVVPTDAPEADGTLDPQAVVLSRDPGRPGRGLQLPGMQSSTGGRDARCPPSIRAGTLTLPTPESPSEE
jgi:hypothetical protein